VTITPSPPTGYCGACRKARKVLYWNELDDEWLCVPCFRGEVGERPPAAGAPRWVRGDPPEEE
jgi:hypothetical protein